MPKDAYPWQPAQEELFARMWGEGASYAQIQKALGDSNITERNLAYKRAAMGLPGRTIRPVNTHWTEEEKARLRKEWPRWDLRLQDLGEMLGRSPASIGAMGKRLGLPNRRQGVGPNGPNMAGSDAPAKPRNVEVAGNFASALPPGQRVSLPRRRTASPVPDVEAEMARREASRRRLEIDGGNLSTERRTA